ncbi:glycoside hydrolase family 26 protein [Cellulomonas sp. PhB143]|uniref:glycoside hydrolase family 26 protein n=1 Tax=Cellulomonas sp. PhB143 TaxID=2485186 RepID=UPI000F49E62B|nr:glycosyl hydrolase [Cellulomonas sp. PhB143]ROS74609.1 glycosyl hydrolase family 26 [Cellulomonas sp. PhB143]
MSDPSKIARTAGLSPLAARIATLVLVVALLTVSAVVWASPQGDSPAAPATKAEARLAAENAALRKEVDRLGQESEQRRIEAKAATEREQGMVSGQKKAAEERAVAEQERVAARQKKDRAAQTQLAGAWAAKGAAERSAAQERGSAQARAEEAAQARVRAGVAEATVAGAQSAAAGAGAQGLRAAADADRRAATATQASSAAKADRDHARADAEAAARRAAKAKADRDHAQAQATGARAQAERARAETERAWGRAGSAKAAQKETAFQLAAVREREAKLKQELADRDTDETPATIEAPTRGQLLHPKDRLFGFYTEQAPWSWSTYDMYEEQAQRDTTIVGYFQGWDRDFRPEGPQRAWARGKLPVMTWEMTALTAGNNESTAPEYSMPRVLSGAFDDYLHKYAKDVAATGLPLGIRLNHEMNGSWYPWSEQGWGGGSVNGNRPGDYAKVWRHVHDIFEEEGANEYVIWIWAPNIVNNLWGGSKSLAFTRSLYPGDAYVDWLGLSGYSRPPYRSGYTPTFSYTYGDTLGQLRQIAHKPIILAEVGASESGGFKPDFVKNFFGGLRDPRNDDVIGFVWFNLAITTYVGGERLTNDWRIGSRSDSLAAFRTGITLPDSGFGDLPKP